MNHIWLNDCAICLRKLKQNKISTKCQHTFHGKCLQEWAKRSHACPLCRTSINVTRNIHNTKDQLVRAIKNFEHQFEKIDYHYIRINFPKKIFSKKNVQLIDNNKYIMVMMWALMYDTKKQFRLLKSTFITMIQVYMKLQNQLQNQKPSFLTEIDDNLGNINLHKRSIAFWKNIYPFHMFEDTSLYGENGKWVLPDYAFMKRIVNALQMHKQNEKLYNSYIKFLTYERKTARSMFLEKTLT
jgi:hypothetical protein